jgi:tRNA 2-selenouridine synthase
MAVQKLTIAEFLDRSASLPVLDVRSPGEYLHAHIPGAISFPLFTDEERKVVGTLYKQRSREAAIKTGLDYFGPKMRRMVEEAEQLTNKQPQSGLPRTVLVHCWRGGMRSGAIAWLLDLYGFKVCTLVGGYKTFRHWVLEQMEQPWPLSILGGHTGSGKTETLVAMDRQGHPVVDLEGLASHKGSAFGAMDMPPQPSQEMFENKLALALHRTASRLEPRQRIWLEDESQRIGKVNLPNAFWAHMRKEPVLFLEIPFEERLNYLVNTYGKWNKGDIAAAITRIQKKLGGLEAKTALGHLVEDDIRECFRILLTYYDKLYQKSLRAREYPDTQVTYLACEVSADPKNVDRIVQQKPITYGKD